MCVFVIPRAVVVRHMCKCVCVHEPNHSVFVVEIRTVFHNGATLSLLPVGRFAYYAYLAVRVRTNVTRGDGMLTRDFEMNGCVCECVRGLCSLAVIISIKPSFFHHHHQPKNLHGNIIPVSGL